VATPGPDRRTIVKVCGITRLEDARAAVDAGADWLGFIVHGESPRRIDPEAAAAIAASVPEMTTVAVMVGVTPGEALDLARRIGVQRVQLHRVDPGSWPEGFPLPVAFAVSVTGEGRLVGRLPALRDLLMLDHASETMAGGTGETFPWEAAVALAVRRPVMLAGGFDGSNVGDALDRVRPYGVDASSRLESAPGIKDHERVRRFVAAVRAYDARLKAAS
jgi:phosphoribosylanthranilate isomerase